MFIEGKVKSYNAERGFGFIHLNTEKNGLFFHIRDLPQPEILPEVGERLSFKIVKEDGK